MDLHFCICLILSWTWKEMTEEWMKYKWVETTGFRVGSSVQKLNPFIHQQTLKSTTIHFPNDCQGRCRTNWTQTHHEMEKLQKLSNYIMLPFKSTSDFDFGIYALSYIHFSIIFLHKITTTDYFLNVKPFYCKSKLSLIPLTKFLGTRGQSGYISPG
jgi:hypothetical protein